MKAQERGAGEILLASRITTGKNRLRLQALMARQTSKLTILLRSINLAYTLLLPAFGPNYHAAYGRELQTYWGHLIYVTTDLDAVRLSNKDITRITHKDTIDDLVKRS